MGRIDEWRNQAGELKSSWGKSAGDEIGEAAASVARLLTHVNEAQRGQRQDGEAMSPADCARLLADARTAAAWAPGALAEMAALMLAARCAGTNAAAYERLRAEIDEAGAGEHDQAAARLGKLVTRLALHEKGSAPDARAAAAEKHAAITIARRIGEAGECERSKEHTIVIGGSAEARRRTFEGAAARTLRVAVVEIEGSSIPATGTNAIWRRACELVGRPADDEDAYPVVRLPNEGVGIVVHDLDALIERWEDEGEIWCLRRTMQTDPRVVLAGTATRWAAGTDDRSRVGGVRQLRRRQPRRVEAENPRWRRRGGCRAATRASRGRAARRRPTRR